MVAALALLSTLLCSTNAAAAPQINTVIPGSARQGQTLNVVLGGLGFFSGLTVTFGTGITINSAVISSSGVGPLSQHILTVNLTIAADAALGPRDITVTNADNSSVTKQDGFLVLPATAGGRLVVAPPSVQFGTVTVGKSRTKKIKIKNIGTDPLTGSLSISGAPFALDSATDFAVAPKKSVTVFLIFSPEAGEAFEGTLTIVSSDPDKPTTNVNLAGKGKVRGH